MSIPTAVFLDTSILEGQNYNFGSVALTSLIELTKAKKLPILLPDPTKREILRHIRARSLEARSALEAARRAAPFLAAWRHFPKLSEMKGRTRDWELERAASAEWDKFLAQFQVIPLDYKGVDINEVMDWYDAIEAPFREGRKRKEFPDALATASLAAYADKAGAYVAVVSLDKDFGAACDRYTHLMHFASLPALLELLLADDKRLDQTLAVIDSATSQLLDAVQDAVGSVPIHHVERAFNEDVEAANIDEVTLSNVRVVALGDQDCTVAFDANVDFTATLHWIEQVEEHARRFYYADEPPYLPEHRCLRSKDVSDYNELTGTAKLRFDHGCTKLERVTLVDFGDEELYMTALP